MILDVNKIVDKTQEAAIKTAITKLKTNMEANAARIGKLEDKDKIAIQNYINDFIKTIK